MSEEQMDALRNPELQSGGRTGIGVVNVERRLKLFFGEESRLVIESVRGVGTVMTIEIPEGQNGGTL